MTKISIPEYQVKISYKYKVNTDDLFLVETSSDASIIARTCFDADTIFWKEEFILICLNRANKVTGFFKVSSGGVAGTVADPKIIFSIALNACASGVILSHNHPSGNLKPSQADKDLTKKLIEAGKLLDITVLDHIIITPDSYLSFADEGLLY